MASAQASGSDHGSTAIAVVAARSEEALLAAASKQQTLDRDREDVFSIVLMDEGPWAFGWTIEWADNLNWAEIFWPV
jgi:hypothetical protein